MCAVSGVLLSACVALQDLSRAFSLVFVKTCLPQLHIFILQIMPDEDTEKVKTSNVAMKLALMLGLTPQSISFGSGAMISSDTSLL